MVRNRLIDNAIKDGLNSIQIGDISPSLQEKLFLFYFNKREILLLWDKNIVKIEKLHKISHPRILQLQSLLAIEISKGSKKVQMPVTNWHHLFSAMKKVEENMNVRISLTNKEGVLKIYHHISSFF